MTLAKEQRPIHTNNMNGIQATEEFTKPLRIDSILHKEATLINLPKPLSQM